MKKDKDYFHPILGMILIPSVIFLTAFALKESRPTNLYRPKQQQNKNYNLPDKNPIPYNLQEIKKDNSLNYFKSQTSPSTRNNNSGNIERLL